VGKEELFLTFLRPLQGEKRTKELLLGGEMRKKRITPLLKEKKKKRIGQFNSTVVVSWGKKKKAAVLRGGEKKKRGPLFLASRVPGPKRESRRDSARKGNVVFDGGGGRRSVPALMYRTRQEGKTRGNSETSPKQGWSYTRQERMPTFESKTKKPTLERGKGPDLKLSGEEGKLLFAKKEEFRGEGRDFPGVEEEGEAYTLI